MDDREPLLATPQGRETVLAPHGHAVAGGDDTGAIVPGRCCKVARGRFTAVVAGLYVELCAGTAYGFGVYSEQLKSVRRTLPDPACLINLPLRATKLPSFPASLLPLPNMACFLLHLCHRMLAGSGRFTGESEPGVVHWERGHVLWHIWWHVL